MSEPDPDQVLAHAVAARHWGVDMAVALRRLGQGSNNTLYLATGPAGRIVVKLSRPHREDGALGEYRKEAWCTARARAAGVDTPEVLDVGVLDGRAFAVLRLVDGQPPTLEQQASTWVALGRAAQRIHGIAVEGWGGTLTGEARFGESWPAHLDYNIGALKDDDQLIARGVFDRPASRRLRHVFESIKGTPFRFALCHGDIALSNTLIDGAGTVWLLDWGCAVAHVAPHYEINEILRGPRPTAEHLGAFLEGYGLTADAYAAMMPDLLALAALREVDTLRWAIDRKPGMIEEMTVRARAAVAKLA